VKLPVQEAEAAKNIMQFLRAVRVTVVLTKVDEGEFRNKFEQEQDGLLVQLRLIFPNCQMLTSGIGNFDTEITKQMVPADSKASAAPTAPTATTAIMVITVLRITMVEADSMATMVLRITMEGVDSTVTMVL